MKLTSEAFTEGGTIPIQYTMEGANETPPLDIQNVPANAKSLALILEDPDAPKKTFIHWLLFNVDPTVHQLNGALPGAGQGKNDFGKSAYGGPKPPKGDPAHRYFFNLFALDTALYLREGINREDLELAMRDHILAQTSLMGKYAHNSD